MTDKKISVPSYWGGIPLAWPSRWFTAWFIVVLLLLVALSTVGGLGGVYAVLITAAASFQFWTYVVYVGMQAQAEEENAE